MKLSALVLGLLGATSVSAAPYYVGQNLQTPNHITLGFEDAPSVKAATSATTTTKGGNIAALDLRAGFSPMNNIGVTAGLPFYMTSSDATYTSRSSTGNVDLGAGWTNTMTSDNRAWTYGYAANASVFVPTSRKNEANVVAIANPTTDLYRYGAKTTSITPLVGFFVGQDLWSAKTNLGYGYSYVTGSQVAPRTGAVVTKKNRNTFTYQLAASLHALPVLNVNVEYNTILLDGATAQNQNKFRQAVTPSISGNIQSILAQAFVTVPLDSTTRNYEKVAFGVNAGYAF